MVMNGARYWGLFWMSAALSLHAFVVGAQLESTFFIMMFFWGFVAISAFRGSLETAQSMAVVMIMILGGLAGASLLGITPKPGLAYAAFALYPSLVSWISVFFYIRHLRHRDGGRPGARTSLWRQHRAG